MASGADRERNFDLNGFILRDASLCDAPQDEVFETHRFAMLLRIFFLVEVPDPHGEERGFARLEP
jgi:hypothetical protein